MKDAGEFCCFDMKVNITEMETITYNKVFDEYSIRILEDSVSVMLLNYCPWCGKRLPNSKREKWVEHLEKIGIENPLLQNANIPNKFKSDDWWKNFSGV